MPNLNFLASTVREILRVSQNSKIGSRDHTLSLLTNFDFFFVRVYDFTAVRLRAKFELSSFNRSRDIRGSQNSKIGSRDPRMILFDPILIFFSLKFTALRLREKFEVFSFNRSRDIMGSQNSKIGSRDPNMTPFDPILNFFR